MNIRNVFVIWDICVYYLVFPSLLFSVYFFACIHVHAPHTMCMQCSQRPEEIIRSPGTGVIDGCEVPYGWWGSNQGLLEEQTVVVTVEPSLQLLWYLFLIILVRQNAEFPLWYFHMCKYCVPFSRKNCSEESRLLFCNSENLFSSLTFFLFLFVLI